MKFRQHKKFARRATPLVINATKRVVMETYDLPEVLFGTFSESSCKIIREMATGSIYTYLTNNVRKKYRWRNPWNLWMIAEKMVEDNLTFVNDKEGNVRISCVDEK